MFLYLTDKIKTDILRMRYKIDKS